jgi:DNA-directed RNA polymerase specialized sigma24 family protein
LLEWLDEDRNRAGERYVRIRSNLLTIFEARGCPVADALADETIDRVAGKIRELAAGYTGSPELYFYGVAHKVYLEYLRHKTIELPPAGSEMTEEVELQYECLERCLARLTTRNRNLILQYYQEGGRTKAEGRRRLARRLGIAPNALRIRAHRIREGLAKCQSDCLKRRLSE